MKEITAYKCDYCNKIYNNAKQIKAHEKKCYYNPDTRSCASCGNFCLIIDAIPEMQYHYTTSQECKKGVDVSNHKLKNRCELWIEKNEIQ